MAFIAGKLFNGQRVTQEAAKTQKNANNFKETTSYEPSILISGRINRNAGRVNIESATIVPTSERNYQQN